MVLLLSLLSALALADEPTKPAPDRPGEVMPDRHWDFLHLDLDVKIDLDAHTIEGTAAHRVRPLGAPYGWIRLHAVALDIREVRVDDRVVEGWRLGDQVLDVPISPDGQEHVVSVAYTARPETGMHFRGGKGTADPIREAWTQGEGEDNRAWFPTWDYPNDKLTVATDVTVRDGLLAFALGEQVGKTSAGGWTTWSYQLERPVPAYLVTVAAGEYAAYQDEGPVPLVFIVPRTSSEQAARRSLGVTGEQMAYLGELLGQPYPYPVYRQIFVSRFLYGGMENATLTVLSDRLLLDDPAARDRSTEDVVAHELAHQWFGDLLTCYGWRELWLNEGFASYYTLRWLEHRYGDERYAAEVRDNMRWALDDAAPMAARSWSKVGDRENAAVYVRGASVLHMLRVLLGDDVFDAGIRRYVRENADRLVETEDLRRVLEEESGRHLGWLFDGWVHGASVPTLKSRWAWDDGELVVTLAQETEGAPFSAPVTIEVGLPDEARTRQVWIGAGETRLILDLERAPRYVAVDAPGGVLARWTHEQDTAAWIAQAQESPTAFARVVAIDSLGEGKSTSEAVAALKGVLRDGKIDPSLRQRAASALGKLGTSDAIEALLASSDDTEPDVRDAVASALGEAPPAETRAAPALQRLVQADVDAYVRASALGALAKLDEDAAVQAARRALGRRDVTPNLAEHGAALSILGAHGEASDWAGLVRKIAADQGGRTRHAAAYAAVAMFKREEDRQEARRPELTRALLPLLDDLDLRTRQLGVGLLGQVGDAKAEAALESLAKRTTVHSPDLARSALDAASAIRSRGPAPEKPPSEDLKRLEQSLEDLTRRLEQVEAWR